MDALASLSGGWANLSEFTFCDVAVELTKPIYVLTAIKRTLSNSVDPDQTRRLIWIYTAGIKYRNLYKRF